MQLEASGDRAGPASDMTSRLAAIREQIGEAARRAGRDGGEIRLIAVSKAHPAEAVMAAIHSGQIIFGENRVQEALDKQAALHALPETVPPLEWHLVGHLQSNKARFVPAAFQWVHTVDRLDLARRLNDAAQAAGTVCSALIQVNVSDDPNKHGIAPAGLVPLVDTMLEADFAALSLRGLMTIGRLNAGEVATRRAFAQLCALRDSLRERSGLPGFGELSMGMSGDFAWAIAEGATMVRVGSALFGRRSVVGEGN
jgi:pyridoxal phosphate enzyme (YggS family)